MSTIDSRGREIAPVSTTLGAALQPSMKLRDRRAVRRDESAAAAEIARIEQRFAVSSYRASLDNQGKLQGIVHTAERGRAAATCAAGLVDHGEAVSAGDPSKAALVADIIVHTVGRMKNQI